MVRINKRLLSTVFLSLAIITHSIAQLDIRVSGIVKSKLTGENLIGAYILQNGTVSGAVTDNNGYFSISSNPPCHLRFSFLGYRTNNIEIKNDTLIIVLLEPGEEQLSEVIISANRNINPNITTINYIQLTQIPILGGKPDVIKSLQLMPGINPQVEGSGLMLVRGGDPGQNLYLFDNIPVVYVNHLGGFMSVFDPEIINNIEVYKGGFPSRYGGKLSSVVDITQKEGNKSGLRGSFGIGITDASFTLEGPLRTNASFILTGRKTMIDPLMALMSSLSDMSTYVISYGFHDINSKVTWKPNDKNSLSLNIYQGDDYLNYWSHGAKSSIDKHRLGNIWGNWLFSVRLNSLVTSRLHVSNSISFTRYRLKEFMKYSLAGEDTSRYERRYRSTVQDISYRSGWKYNASANWMIEFGLQTSLFRLAPNDTYISDINVQPPVLVSNSLETAVYADNKITILKNSQVIPGLRVVNHTSAGYSGFTFEPRFNMNIAVMKDHTLNASYMRVNQFSHLVFTPGNIMNNEVWIPAGKNIPPARSDQYTVGWNYINNDKKFSIEANAYFKSMSNLSAFREGYTSLWGDDNWILKVETGGIGKSAGLELLIKKNSGKWTGFAGYTLSKTTRQFPGINRGKEFLFEYNRPHSFSININHKLNEKLGLSLTWVYQSGLPFTPAIGRQYLLSPEKNFEGEDFYYEALIYGERNSSRLRDYHRLDLGLNYSKLTRNGRKAIWNFSVYNAYNRHNPVYYYYNTNKTGEIFRPEFGYSESRPLSLYQLSLFPIIPSLSYKVFFDGNRVKDEIYESVRKIKKDRESYIKNRWNIKAGYSSYKPVPKEVIPYFRLEANYGIMGNIESGVYIGYSKFKAERWISPGFLLTRDFQTFSFGVNSNYHLLPVMVHRDDFMFDLYLTGKFGGTKSSNLGRLMTEFKYGAGIAAYLTKHAGLFVESVLDKNFYRRHPDLRFGLTFKF